MKSEANSCLKLDIILNSETSIGATLAALKKSLAHYEKEKMDLYAKRQKYRIVVANYKGPVNDVKLEAIKQILHTDLPKLIDEMDDRIINGHIQVTGMERQLANLRTQRLKAERSYQRLFEPMPEGDLEGGPEYFSDDSSDIGKDATIDDVLRKFDPEYVDQAIPADAIDDTESESAEEDTSLTKSASNIKNLKINPRSSNSALPNQFNPSFPPAVLEARPSEDTIAIPLD